MPIFKLGQTGAGSRHEGHHLNPTNDKGMWNYSSHEELAHLPYMVSFEQVRD